MIFRMLGSPYGINNSHYLGVSVFCCENSPYRLPSWCFSLEVHMLVPQILDAVHPLSGGRLKFGIFLWKVLHNFFFRKVFVFLWFFGFPALSFSFLCRFRFNLLFVYRDWSLSAIVWLMAPTFANVALPPTFGLWVTFKLAFWAGFA